MTAKHTPGPWVIEMADVGDEEFILLPHEIVGGDGFKVITADGGLSGGFQEFTFETINANATLIAAAPDMLAALKSLDKHLRPWVEGLSLIPSKGSPPDLAIKEMIAAIAKAEGKL